MYTCLSCNSGFPCVQSLKDELMAASFEEIMDILRNIASKVDADSVMQVWK